MEKFDPYALLGVTRAASYAAIKTAYRQRVQSAHPDRGGDPEEFIAVVRAFGLLSDPDARRLYDEAGIVDEDGVRNYRRDVATILADMFDAAVEAAVATGLRLHGVDFISQMTAAVRTGLADAGEAQTRIEGEIAALESLRNRIRRNGEGHNLFAERIETQISAKAAQNSALRRRMLVLDTAVVELGNYDSEVELIAALEAGE